MLYFVPAWYKENSWIENEQQWYMRRMKSEFDETIKQISQKCGCEVSDSFTWLFTKFQAFLS